MIIVDAQQLSTLFLCLVLTTIISSQFYFSVFCTFFHMNIIKQVSE